MESNEHTPRSFRDLDLSEVTLAAVEAMEWTVPTPIQRKAIPPGLLGEDVVGIAQTGTGKTGAFLIPALERIQAGGGLQVLAVCPTRELAQQVAEEAELLSKGTSLRADFIVGGVDYKPQIHALESGFEILAVTPGRFIDHMKSSRVDLSGLRVLILDEADRLLDMGFRPQIEEIIKGAPRAGRQTMLFSATMPQGVHALALRVTDDPVWVEAAPSGTTASGITELVYSVKPEKKTELLSHLLDEPEWDQVLVFSRTKAGADVLQSRLERDGIRTGVMHSDRAQRARERALDRFAEGNVRVLVATDIAQRGLDVEGISHVVNYDIPRDPEDYVHRIGRTGRAGAVGTAVTFVTGLDLGYLKSIEHRLGRKLDRIHLPEFDYAGSPREEGRDERRKHSRTGGGMGSRSAEDLTPEELEELLKVG